MGELVVSLTTPDFQDFFVSQAFPRSVSCEWDQSILNQARIRSLGLLLSSLGRTGALRLDPKSRFLDLAVSSGKI